MKHFYLNPLLSLLALALISSACNGLGSSPVETVSPTATQAVTATQPLPTSTIPPTKTQVPTATFSPPTPTAVSIKDLVINDQYEIKILTKRILDSATTGGLVYTANPGYKFLELTVRVNNLQKDQQQSFKWQDVYLIYPDNQHENPFFAGSFVANNNEEINAATLPFEGVYSELPPIVFEKTAYLRVIWLVSDDNIGNYFFLLDNAQLIEIPYK